MTGFMGRVGIYETLLFTSAIKSAGARQGGSRGAARAGLQGRHEAAAHQRRDEGRRRPHHHRGSAQGRAAGARRRRRARRVLDVLLLVVLSRRRGLPGDASARAPRDERTLGEAQEQTSALPRPDRAVGRLVLGDRRRAPHHLALGRRAGGHLLRRARRPTASASGRSRASRSSARALEALLERLDGAAAVLRPRDRAHRRARRAPDPHHLRPVAPRRRRRASSATAASGATSPSSAAPSARCPQAKERLELALGGGNLAEWDYDLESRPASTSATAGRAFLGREPVAERDARRRPDRAGAPRRPAGAAAGARCAALKGETPELRRRLPRAHARAAAGAGCTRAARSPSATRNGRAPRMSGTVADIDDAARAEEALRETEQRYRLLVELAPDGVIVHCGGIIEYANPAAARLFGATSPKRLAGLVLEEFAPPDERERMRERLRYLEAGPGWLGFEQRAHGHASTAARSWSTAPACRSSSAAAWWSSPCSATSPTRRARARRSPSASSASATSPRPRASTSGRPTRAVALHLPVGARRGGARLPARRAARPQAAGLHAAGRGARGARSGSPSTPPKARPFRDLVHRSITKSGGVIWQSVSARAGARRRRRARRLPRHRRRRHRAQAGRGAHRVPRHARRAHRAAQPHAARRPRRPGDPRRGAQPLAARAAVHRPRPLQAGERLARPPRPATRCCARSPSAWAARCAARTRWRAWAATSSCCCGTASSRPRTPRRSRSASSASWRGRSPSRAARSTSAPRSASASTRATAATSPSC